MIEDDDILRAAAMPQRLVLLEEAMRLTGVERRAVYGDPVVNHAHIARIFNAWTGRDLTGRDLTAAEIVMVHMATKMARMATTPDHRDSHVDLMAYAGIRYECVLADTLEAGDDRSA
jgi:hypothetical protein